MATKDETQSMNDKTSHNDPDVSYVRWPKIQLSSEFKEDIRKAFALFDQTGQGTINVDDVRVAFRALGYDSSMCEFKNLRQQTKEFQGKIDFGEFLNLLEDRMLSIDNDMDIEKIFELFDVNNKGYIDFDDLKRTVEYLELDDLYDDSLISMLLGAQIKNTNDELRKQYNERQLQTRLNKGKLYKTNESNSWTTINGLPNFNRLRRISSSGQQNPHTLTVNFEQFKNLMTMTRPPTEDITLL